MSAEWARLIPFVLSLRDKLVKMGGMEILKKTALHAVLAGISLPLTVVNTSTMLLDSDFSRCRVRLLPFPSPLRRPHSG